MFKKVLLSLVLLAPFTGMAASADVAATASESFTAANGSIFNIRPVREGDFADELIRKDFSEAVLANRLQRCRDKEAGIFVVESTAGDIVGRVLAGNMPLGYQPWPATTEDDINRSKVILSFYEALLNAHHRAIAPSKKHREGGMDLLHVSPEVVALTVVLGGDFGTVSAQEAIVKLVRAQSIKTPRDPGVTEPAVPLFCLSITQSKDFASTDLTTVYPGLPYYSASAETDGLRSAVVTSLADGIIFPKPGEYATRGDWITLA
jgi:hypothetical protein